MASIKVNLPTHQLTTYRFHRNPLLCLNLSLLNIWHLLKKGWKLFSEKIVKSVQSFWSLQNFKLCITSCSKSNLHLLEKKLNEEDDENEEPMWLNFPIKGTIRWSWSKLSQVKSCRDKDIKHPYDKVLECLGNVQMNMLSCVNWSSQGKATVFVIWSFTLFCGQFFQLRTLISNDLYRLTWGQFVGSHIYPTSYFNMNCFICFLLYRKSGKVYCFHPSTAFMP